MTFSRISSTSEALAFALEVLENIKVLYMDLQLIYMIYISIIYIWYEERKHGYFINDVVMSVMIR